HSRTSRVVNGSAALRSMRTPRARSAAVGFGPRTATTMRESSSSSFGVRPSASVAPNSALVPTPVWNTAAFAGCSSSERSGAPLGAAADVGHLAEALPVVEHVEQPPLQGHLRLAFSEEEKAGAALVLAHHDLALVDPAPAAGAHQLPDLVIGQRREHVHGLQRDILLAVGNRAARQHLLAELRQLGGEFGPAPVALR